MNNTVACTNRISIETRTIQSTTEFYTESGYCAADILKNKQNVFGETGKIEYELALINGTGNGQVNVLWADKNTLNGTKTYNLYNLTHNRLNNLQNKSMAGAGGGSIRGIVFKNLGANNLSLQLPFGNTTTPFLIPPSGEQILSSYDGWELPASSVAIVSISGNSSYEIGLVGAARPLELNVDSVIPIEYKGSSLLSNIVNLEFTQVLNVNHSTNYEMMRLIDTSSRDTLVFEGLLDPAPPASTNFEYATNVNFDVLLNFEIENTGLHDLLRNKTWAPSSYGLDYTYSITNFDAAYQYVDRNLPGNIRRYIEMTNYGSTNVGGTAANFEMIGLPHWFHTHQLVWAYQENGSAYFATPGPTIIRTLSTDNIDHRLTLGGVGLGIPCNVYTVVDNMSLATQYRLGFTNTRSNANYWPFSLKIRDGNGLTGTILNQVTYNTNATQQLDEIIFTSVTSTATIEWSIPQGDLTHLSTVLPGALAVASNPYWELHCNHAQSNFYLRNY